MAPEKKEAAAAAVAAAAAPVQCVRHGGGGTRSSGRLALGRFAVRAAGDAVRVRDGPGGHHHAPGGTCVRVMHE